MEDQRWRLFRQILEGLNHIHLQGGALSSSLRDSSISFGLVMLFISLTSYRSSPCSSYYVIQLANGAEYYQNGCRIYCAVKPQHRASRWHLRISRNFHYLHFLQLLPMQNWIQFPQRSLNKSKVLLIIMNYQSQSQLLSKPDNTGQHIDDLILTKS